jgi:hypothetical protein
MATTTNYGWDTPDDTDLVKDGAAAIRTLGSSVDTTTKALNPSTTEGDIEYRSATANTNTRLGIGTAGQVLRVNSGADAPEWATPAAGGMTLLSTTNLSGTTTSITGINQTYTNLLVLVQDPYLSAVQELAIRPNAVTDPVLGWRWYVGASINTTTHLRNEINLGTTTSAANSGYSLLINNYADTTYGKTFYMTGNATSSNSTVIKSGIINTASAITSIDFTTNTGVPTFSGGRVLIYGVK